MKNALRQTVKKAGPKLINIKPYPASVFEQLHLPRTLSPSQAKVAASTKKPMTVAAQLEQRALTQQNWSSNMRVQDVVNNKQLYWNVSKPARDTLKKLMRES